MSERGASGEGLFRALHHLETGLMALLMVSMVVVAFGQIVLRNLFDFSFLWADPFLRHLVLWTGMLGAAMATRDGRHIKIDVLSQLLPPRGRLVLNTLTNLFSASVCGVLVYAAYKFVRDEFQFGGEAFLSIPGWIVQLILPAAFVLITIRFFLVAVDCARQAWRHEAAETPGPEDGA